MPRQDFRWSNRDKCFCYPASFFTSSSSLSRLLPRALVTSACVFGPCRTTGNRFYLLLAPALARRLRASDRPARWPTFGRPSRRRPLRRRRRRLRSSTPLPLRPRFSGRRRAPPVRRLWLLQRETGKAVSRVNACRSDPGFFGRMGSRGSGEPLAAGFAASSMAAGDSRSSREGGAFFRKALLLPDSTRFKVASVAFHLTPGHVSGGGFFHAPRHVLRGSGQGRKWGGLGTCHRSLRRPAGGVRGEPFLVPPWGGNRHLTLSG